MNHEQDDPGTDWNERARAAKPDWMSPRMAWRAIQAALAARGDHLVRHRQQLRHRQRLSRLRRRSQIPGTGSVRPLRLRPAVHRRRQDRPARRAGRRFRRRRCLWHRGQRTDSHWSRRLACDHADRLPQLPVGRGKAELDALVRRQLRRHRTGRGSLLCRYRARLAA